MDSWDDIRIFLAVARQDSLSAAGRSLRIDPATVGRRIARLEQAVGQPLFAKSPQGYALTDAGQRLLPHAERAELATQDAAEALAGGAGQLTGQIRIGAPDGCANFILPRVCAAMARDNPELEIQILSQPRVVNLSKREADLAISVSRPTAGRLSVQKITDYHLHVAAADSYLAAAPAIETVADLRHHRVVGYISDMIFDQELDYLSEMATERVHLASNSVSVQLNWLRQGGGIGIVHDFALPFAPELRKVLTGAISLQRAFYLVRHADDRRLERMNRFAAALVAGMRGEVARLEALAQ
ncbi:MAG: LysR family transcriptional regulator [Rhodobacteraceae bacterium]|nr:MAG: LysR family transcriptional regulator [Paracoccaceae bacterium]